MKKRRTRKCPHCGHRMREVYEFNKEIFRPEDGIKLHLEQIRRDNNLSISGKALMTAIVLETEGREREHAPERDIVRTVELITSDLPEEEISRRLGQIKGIGY